MAFYAMVYCFKCQEKYGAAASLQQYVNLNKDSILGWLSPSPSPSPKNGLESVKQVCSQEALPMQRLCNMPQI